MLKLNCTSENIIEERELLPFRRSLSGCGSEILLRKIFLFQIASVIFILICLTGSKTVWAQQGLNLERIGQFSNTVEDAGVAQSTTPVRVQPVESKEINGLPEVELGVCRINISWSSLKQGSWGGSITLSQGSFIETVPLGEDPVSPCLLRLEDEKNGKISFENNRPLFFLGLQTTVCASLDANIKIVLCEKRSGHKIDTQIPLRQLISGPVHLPFDETENGILIERIPGDDLPVRIFNKSGNKWNFNAVFKQGETLILSVWPRLYNLTSPDQNLVLNVTLTQSGRNNIIWSDSREVFSKETLSKQNGSKDIIGQGVGKEVSSRINFQIPIPDIEGAFDLNLSLTGNSGRSVFPLFTNPLGSAKGTVLAGRVVQGVVLPKARLLKSKKGQAKTENFRRDLRDGLLVTIDPTNPAWWMVFGKSSLFGRKEVKKDAAQIRGQQLLPASFLNADFLKVWKMGGFQLNLTSWRSASGWGQWEDFWRTSRGSGHLKLFRSPLTVYQNFVELSCDSNPEVTPWESYTVQVKEPGKPHLLEIEYLSHLPQLLGVSIIEPTVSGGIFPRSLDYGLSVSANKVNDQLSDKVCRFQILFWPKTKNPTILLMNRDKKHSAVFGKIKIYRAKDNLEEDNSFQGGRLFGAMMTRPLFCDQFAAVRIDSPLGVHGMEDWNSFYSAIERMILELRASSNNAMMLSVLSDGSSIYPCPFLNPTPRWDSGIFLSRGEDPVRKDVLDLAIRSFEQENLQLIPLVNLNAPLPRLEEHFRKAVNSGDADKIRWSEGIYSLGPERATYIDQTVSTDGTGPYYNLLHPYVQEAVAGIITDLAARCAFSRSFRGIAIELSANNYMQLPDDIYYGMDDFTITRFFRESGVVGRLDPAGLKSLMAQTDFNRYRARAIYIKTNCLDDWIRWRAEEIGKFYKKLGAILQQYRQGTSLYLVGTEMLRGRQSENRIHPEISGFPSFAQALRMIGFNSTDYNNRDSNVIFLRPGYMEETGGLNEKALAGLFDHYDIIRFFAGEQSGSGVSFFHRAESKKLTDFEQKSPYRPTCTDIMTRAIPSDFENRRRFSQQLAGADTQFYFDGGEMLPFGGESSMQEWISVFRTLPALPFRDVQFPGAKEGKPDTKDLGPVRIRCCRLEKELWFYVVNNAPFHTGLKVFGKYLSNAEFKVYSGGQEIAAPSLENESYQWSFSMRPYDLIAWKITDANAVLERAEVSLPSEICDSGGLLAQSVQNYTDRLLIARRGIPLDLPKASSAEVVTPSEKNGKKILSIEVPKFNLLKGGHNPPKEQKENTTETVSDGKGSVHDEEMKKDSGVPAEDLARWQRFGDQSFETVLDSQNKQSSHPRLRLTSCGTPGGILSPELKMPITGRICLHSQFGIPSGARSLPLYITLTGRYQGKPYIRKLEIGTALLAKKDQAMRNGELDNQPVFWTEDMIFFEKLPMTGLDGLSLRFDLLSEGSVWFEQIRFYQLAFTEAEQRDLIEKVQKADSFASSGNVAESLALLNDYWTKILDELIPAGSPLLAERPVRPMLIPKKEQAKKDPASEQPVKEANNNIFKKLMFWK